MKTIELVDRKGRKHTYSFVQAEAILRLGTNCMNPMSIPDGSKYYYDGAIKKKVIKTPKREVEDKEPIRTEKKEVSERKGSTRKDNDLGWKEIS